MTMEEYFIKELQEYKDKLEKKESRLREYEEDRRKIEDGLRDVEWLVKKVNPYWTSDGAIIMDFAFLHGDDVKRALAVFARLGVEVKAEKLTEKGKVETR